MANTEDVKKLREETNVSIMECKKALEEAGGDFSKAREILSSRGSKVAEKKSSRETKSGVIDSYIHTDNKKGAMVELFCETDFVARNDVFKRLAHEIAMQIVVVSPKDREELLSSEFIKDESKTIKDLIEETISVLGENIQLGEFTHFEL